MTCIRILEVIPVVFERLPNDSGLLLEAFDNMKWLHDLVDWGKSSLAVVVRYWKETLVYLLGQFKAICGNKSVPAVSDIERLISCGELFNSLLCFPPTVPNNYLLVSYLHQRFWECRKSVNG